MTTQHVESWKGPGGEGGKGMKGHFREARTGRRQGTGQGSADTMGRDM